MKDPKLLRCPTCNNTMILDFDKAVYHCINCARKWTRVELEERKP